MKEDKRKQRKNEWEGWREAEVRRAGCEPEEGCEHCAWSAGESSTRVPGHTFPVRGWDASALRWEGAW